MPSETKTQYPHYYKAIPEGVTHVDVYHVLRLFEVTDGAVAHAVKKLLCGGKRGAKNRATDLQEAVKSVQRALELDELEQSEGENALEVLAAEAQKYGLGYEKLQLSSEELAKMSDLIDNPPEPSEALKTAADRWTNDTGRFYNQLAKVMGLPRKEAKTRWLQAQHLEVVEEGTQDHTKLTPENCLQCVDCMTLETEDVSVCVRNDSKPRCATCSNRVTPEQMQAIGEQTKSDYEAAVQEAEATGRKLDAISEAKHGHDYSYRIELKFDYNAIGDASYVSIPLIRSALVDKDAMSVRVENRKHALRLMNYLGNQIAFRVTFYWFNEALAAVGQWEELRQRQLSEAELIEIEKSQHLANHHPVHDFF